MKIQLDNLSVKSLRDKLTRLDKKSVTVNEFDVYLDRDLELTAADKAFRIRLTDSTHVTVSSLELTFKGPKLSTTVKTRMETTLCLVESCLEETVAFFVQLGFQPIGRVSKKRMTWKIEKEGRVFSISLDDVKDLGTFMEIETIADESNQEEAEQSLNSVLESLIGKKTASESKSIMKSYFA